MNDIQAIALYPYPSFFSTDKPAVQEVLQKIVQGIVAVDFCGIKSGQIKIVLRQ